MMVNSDEQFPHIMRQAQYWKGPGVVDVAVYSLLCSDMNANGSNPDCSK